MRANIPGCAIDLAIIVVSDILGQAGGRSAGISNALRTTSLDRIIRNVPASDVERPSTARKVTGSVGDVPLVLVLIDISEVHSSVLVAVKVHSPHGLVENRLGILMPGLLARRCHGEFVGRHTEAATLDRVGVGSDIVGDTNVLALDGDARHGHVLSANGTGHTSAVSVFNVELVSVLKLEARGGASVV